MKHASVVDTLLREANIYFTKPQRGEIDVTIHFLDGSYVVMENVAGMTDIHAYAFDSDVIKSLSRVEKKSPAGVPDDSKNSPK